jgi:hypothetical protein
LTHDFVIYSKEHWPTLRQLFEKKTLYIKIMEKHFTLMPLKPSVCCEGTNMTQLSSVTKPSTSSPVLNKLAQCDNNSAIKTSNKQAAFPNLPQKQYFNYSHFLA